METATILKNNILTIPKKVREAMNINVGDKVMFSEIEGGGFILKKLDEKKMNEFLLIDTKAPYGSKNDSL